jgi:hypothetical protein
VSPVQFSALERPGVSKREELGHAREPFTAAARKGVTRWKHASHLVLYLAGHFHVELIHSKEHNHVRALA